MSDMEELGRGDTLAFYKAADGFAFNRTETLEQIASGTSAEFILLFNPGKTSLIDSTYHT